MLLELFLSMAIGQRKWCESRDLPSKRHWQPGRWISSHCFILWSIASFFLVWKTKNFWCEKPDKPKPTGCIQNSYTTQLISLVDALAIHSSITEGTIDCHLQTNGNIIIFFLLLFTNFLIIQTSAWIAPLFFKPQSSIARNKDVVIWNLSLTLNASLKMSIIFGFYVIA